MIYCGYGGRQQRDQRRKDFGNGADHAGHTKSQLFRLPHGHPLGHQLTEDEGKVGKNDGDQNDHDGMEGAFRERQAKVQQPLHDGVGKVFRGEGGTKEAGQGDGHLNGGEETGGLVGQTGKLHGALVAAFGHPGQLVVVKLNDGDFCAGKNCVEGDQRQLQQNHQ